MKDLVRQKLSINVDIMDLLNEQIQKEAHSSSAYLAMASWCDQNGLTGSAEFFYKQALEERDPFAKGGLEGDLAVVELARVLELALPLLFVGMWLMPSESDSAEPQIVEQVLERVGEVREIDHPEHARQALERVDRAEDVVVLLPVLAAGRVAHLLLPENNDRGSNLAQMDLETIAPRILPTW